MEAIWDWGISVNLWFQGLGEAWLGFMHFITFFGGEEFFLLLLPMLFWCVDAVIGLRVGLVLMLSSNINYLLKMSLQDPRPYWYNTKVVAYSSETGFGLPSGHSQQSAVVWLSIAAQLRKPWAWAAAIIITLLVGISRLYLGVHFITDILLGWALAALIVWLYFRLEPWFITVLHRTNLKQHMLASALFSLILIGLAVPFALSSPEFPAIWLTNALAAGAEEPDPYSIEGIISTAGVICGLGIGAAWLYQHGWFSADGSLGQRVARYILGLFGVVLLWYGLKLVFYSGDDLLGYTLRYIRYALVGLWVSGIAPTLFIRFGLAQPDPRVKPSPAR